MRPAHLHGLLARFDTPEDLLAAARLVNRKGYTRVETYSPYEIEGMTATLGKKPSIIPVYILGAGFSAVLLGFGMQFFATTIHYPWNVGGRPLNSWPAYIPITFELTILFAGVIGVLAFIIANRLPRLYNPLFDAPEFDRAANNAFFLFISSADSIFRAPQTHQTLKEAGALQITTIASQELVHREGLVE